MSPDDATRTAQATRTRLWRTALAGVAAAVAGLGAAELVSAVAAPEGSPLFVVGALVIDIAPGWAKEAIIAVFGTNDKAALLVMLAILVIILAALAGILEWVRPLVGRAVFAVGGLIGVIAAATRAGASWPATVPSIAAAAVAILVVTFLLKHLGMRRSASSTTAALDRRRFLVYTGSTAALGVLAVIGGRMLTASARAADAARSVLRLPKPAVSAPPIPATASLDVPGLAPLITPNPEFYRIDTALRVPRISTEEWSLRITGMVEHEVEIGYAELLALPLEESRTTLACVSNPVGGELIGTATWLGYPIRELLQRANPHSDADMVLSRSVDGWTAGTPIEALTDERNAILAVGMNGEPLPFEHGFPVRMVVPGLYGYVSATKWLSRLEVTRFDLEAGYWTHRGWSAHGPVKLSSRIDVPRPGTQLQTGTVVVAGVAWEQRVGIRAVHVRVDSGDWNEARLATALNRDTWRQWRWEWPAAPGVHKLTVRATDNKGRVQTSEVVGVVPDGATGLDSMVVTVT